MLLGDIIMLTPHAEPFGYWYPEKDNLQFQNWNYNLLS